MAKRFSPFYYLSALTEAGNGYVLEGSTEREKSWLKWKYWCICALLLTKSTSAVWMSSHFLHSVNQREVSRHCLLLILASALEGEEKQSPTQWKPGSFPLHYYTCCTMGLYTAVTPSWYGCISGEAELLWFVYKWFTLKQTWSLGRT